MFAPRVGRIARPAWSRASQCLRQQGEATQRSSIVRQLRQQRHQSNESRNSTARAARSLFKSHPFSVTAAFLIILSATGTLLYSNYIYHNYIIGAFHKFPEPVAKQLRKALFYTNYNLQPKDALRYYREALRVADEVGMDPFSDEIIGVKIQVAAMMEKIEQYQKAIDVLEIVRSDNLKWVEVLGDKPGNEGQRTKILAKTVGVSVKLAELYGNEHILRKEDAEDRLIWAVETSLKEQQRREKDGVKPDEGDWMSAEEMGGALEALAHHYEEKDQHYLATPLFLQALGLSPPKSCHTAVLMNNLSISLAQQVPPTTPGQAPVSRPALVSNARAWAQKSLALTSIIQPPDRTEECDVSCAVATYNLGEFAEMDGDIREARKRYEEAKSLSSAMGFQEGASNSEEALRRLERA